MKRIFVATSNPGKIRDLVGAAAPHNVQIEMLPGFSSLPSVVEDGATFEANARKKAEYYSKHAEGEVAIADDSGLEADALQGAPGVRSARYAADEPNAHLGSANVDEANNARLLRELHDVPDEFRTARFVCVIAAARNGHTLATFHGKAEGMILHAPRGCNGFGYDPLFYFREIGKTFAELAAEKNKLVADLRKEVATLSVLAAEKLMRKSVDDGVQKNVLDGFFKDLETNKASKN